MRDNPDHHDAELLLRLYELRREEKLRRARDWFLREFRADTVEEYSRNYSASSEESAFIRMTVTYWEMAASVVNHGLIHEEFFFESGGELWAVWMKISPLAPGLRERAKNPHLYGNLEKLALKYEKWMEARAPGHLEMRRQQLAAPASGRSAK